MAILDVKVLSEGFSFFVGRFPKEAAKEMGDAAWKTATRFRSVFVKARLSGRPGLNRITGGLIRSFRVGRSPRGAPLDHIVSWLASGSPYASIHETGGTIRPKRRRALAIPISPEFGGQAMTGAGAVKGEAVRVMPETQKFGRVTIRKGERSLRARTDLTPIKSKKGNLLLVKKVGDRIIPMYVLKSSVKIPARMKFYDTFRSWSGRPAALRFFSSALRRLFERLWGKGGRR